MIMEAGRFAVMEPHLEGMDMRVRGPVMLVFTLSINRESSGLDIRGGAAAAPRI